jgi:hypothetical protein
VKRKVEVPPDVSRQWRRLGLPRELAISLWNYVQLDIPEKYESLRTNRAPDGRGFKVKKAFQDNQGNAHLFIIIVDDESSPDHLFIAEIYHIPRQP